MAETILPHGGTLINRVAEGAQREQLLEQAKSLYQLKINAWTISDLDLIGVGAFSPLTGFLGEEDYRSVVERMRLANGTVWSIPITLAVEADVASKLQEGLTSGSCRRERRRCVWYYRRTEHLPN